MKITLNRLTLTNFKGIRSLDIRFDEVTSIFGANATGKTTVFDAFLYLLFDKDSTDRKDFEIKTLGPDNEPYHRLDHEVSASLFINGEELNLRKVFREKWVKKRGSSDTEFTGHETSYFWNDVPLKKEEYQSKIAAIVDEKIFKLITNATYFNSLKWQDRRAVLLQLAGDINDGEVLNSLSGESSHVARLRAALDARKSIEEFRREIGAKKKKIKDELILLPSRIDEANRSLPEEKDYSAIECQISEAQADLEHTESLLMNKSKAAKEHQESVNAKIREIQVLQKDLTDIEWSEKNKALDRKRQREQAISGLRRDLSIKQDELNRSIREYTNDKSRKEQLEKDKEQLAAQWGQINETSLEFDEGEFHCPACKRAYEASDIEAKKAELTRNFNKDKSRRLEEIVKRGSGVADEIKALEVKMGNTKAAGETLRADTEIMQARIAEAEQEHNRLTADEDSEVKGAIAANTEYQAITEKLALLNEEVNTPFKAEDNSELITRKRDLQTRIDSLRSELSSREQRTRILERIEELMTQEQTLTQELAGLEGVEFTIEAFTRAKMDLLESRINGKFRLVKFKMFEEQINGGQTETCEALINGVPYSDANTASKINAGLDVIRTLSEHYGILAPVFVDNAESIVSLIKVNSQLIRLIVSGSHKTLTVESGAMEAVA